MTTAVQLPALSPTMKEGKITKWLKKEGDAVKSGEALAECETDKSNLEIEAYDDGVLLQILVKEGESAEVGATIAVIGAKGEKVEKTAAPAAAKAEEKKPTAPAAKAEEKKPAAPAAKAEPAPEQKVVPLRPPTEAPAPASDGDRLRASPLAKKMARTEGLDLGSVQGSGPQGRIIKRDVEAAMTQGAGDKASGKPAAKSSGRPVAPYIAPGGPRPEPTKIAISGMRKTISARMGEVKPGVPHFYLTIDVEMDEAVKVREQAKQAEVKVSVNDMIVKAAAVALKRYPKINVSFQGDHVLQLGTADVGIAVAIEDGLITPVVRDADFKSLGQIGAEARDLAERARRRALKPEEYTGGSITISNLGMLAIDTFIAVINPPQAAILAIGTVNEKPVVRNGQVVIRKMMSVTLSGDHRAIDGAVGAEYLKVFRELLENPVRLLF